MKNKIIIGLMVFICSCQINFKIKTTRILDFADDTQMEKESNLFLNSIGNKIDTLLTLESSDCHPYEEEYIIHIYKKSGITQAKVITDQAYFSLTPMLENFNWDSILKSKDLILSQKPKPSFWASVIEGDTIWRNNMNTQISGETVWTFTLITNNDTLKWYSTESERNQNPSMEKTKIYKYVMSESKNKIWSSSSIFGKRKYRIKPIIGKRKK